MNLEQFEIILSRLDRIEDRLDSRIDSMDDRLATVEDTLTRYKGWVAGFTAISVVAGSIFKWG